MHQASRLAATDEQAVGAAALRTTVALEVAQRWARRNDGFGNVNIPSNRITANLTDACFGNLLL